MKTKLLSIILSAAIMAGMTAATGAVNAEQTDGEHYYGLVPDDESVLLEHLENETVNIGRADGINATSSLPSSVDLSQSSYFPPITSQGNRGTCTAFATTYYQFTYEINKLNHTSANSDGSIYSPEWTFSFLAVENGETGMAMSTAYTILEKAGGCTLADMPYLSYEANGGATSWNTDFSLAAKAAEKRLDNWYTTNINTADTPITSPSSAYLDNVKKKLVNGYVLTVATDTDYNIMESSEYGKIIVRVGKANSGHALTVVGYNDNVCIDVNGDGTISPSERGAFKIANSWGSDYANNGYVWVLYDALNSVSQISGNWQNAYQSTRKQAFGLGGSANYFYMITVKNDTPYVFGKLNVSSDDMTQMSVSTGISGDAVRTKKETSVFNFTGRSAAFSGTIAFPHCSPENLDLALSDGKWTGYVREKNNDDKSLTVRGYSLVDNLGNVIKDFGTLNDNVNADIFEYSADLSITKGDVDYDGRITVTDALFVNQSTVGKVTPSYLQNYLADYNNDGVVNGTDVLAIMQAAT